MKLKITKSDKKALLAALAVCGIGILFSILIVLGMDIYRKHTSNKLGIGSIGITLLFAAAEG